jgi:DNA primase
MGRTFSGQSSAPKYSESHVKGILKEIGVRVSAETFHDFLCFCPLHNNRHTPSLSVSKTKDGYLCFNADCGASGTLIDLVSKVTGRNYFEAARFVLLHQPTVQDDFEEELASLLSDEPEFREFSSEVLGNLSMGMESADSPGRGYMHGRGFTDDTIDYFKVGYSKKKNMVAVPVHSPDGVPIGLVGRSISSKAFKNSVKLPTSKTFFNIHRAKRTSSTAILVESSFDAMALYQAGFPNAIGNLGTHMSPYKLALLDRYFDRIIIFTDNRDYDEAGKKLGDIVADKFIKTKDVLWANYRYGETYPGDLKDATDILKKHGAEALAECVHNAIPHYEYASSMV